MKWGCMGSIVLCLAASLYLAVGFHDLGRHAIENQVGETVPVAPETVLGAGRLAVLPANATDVRSEKWSGVFTGESWLSFKAPREEVCLFLTTSPSLESQLPEFSADLCHRADSGESDWEKYLREAFHLEFEIPAESGHNWGKVTIDPAGEHVHIHVVWS